MSLTEVTVLSIAFCVSCLSGSEFPLRYYLKALCDRNPIHTTSKRTMGDHRFQILLENNKMEEIGSKFRPGERYTVIVNATDERLTMLGFMLTAKIKSSANFSNAGTFDVRKNYEVQDLFTEDICDHHVISHQYLIDKKEVRFNWTAPNVPSSPCIEFKATVIAEPSKWFKDDGALTKEVCEFVGKYDEVTADSPKTNSVAQETEKPEDECCACGHAVYSVTFQGLWSRHAHTKNFPDSNSGSLLHWSNVVGSSHTNDYRIWDYGTLASRAVKEVCEFGSSRSLELDMKDNSEKIRTVIKTKSLWGPEKILDSVKSVYTVNKKKHFLSLLTMIGPSPDWCLGVSAASMCGANCSWVNGKEVFLYPWDAGTDSGISYMSPNQPTQPPEKIHNLTTTYPNDWDSPFYGQVNFPMAKLIIRKNKDYCSEDEGDTDARVTDPSTDELVSIMKEKMMMKKKLEMEKCSTSQWEKWEPCSSACAEGSRIRRRTLANPGILESMCNVNLMQKEACIGKCIPRQKNRHKISTNFVMRHDVGRDSEDACAVTGWSDWSPCSETCELGVIERSRMFLHRFADSESCKVHLMERDLCRGNILECRKATKLRNYAAICKQETEVGPCDGKFPRWFYNIHERVCDLFFYGGCDGNENRFISKDDCEEMCSSIYGSADSAPLEGVSRDNNLTNRQMTKFKGKYNNKRLKDLPNEQLRHIIAKSFQTGSMRDKKYMKALGDTPNLSQVKDAITLIEQAMRELKSKPIELPIKTSMMHDQKRLLRKLRRKEGRLTQRNDVSAGQSGRSRRRRRQRKHDNDFQPALDCMLTPWSEWSPCNVSCGKGMVTRFRTIKQEAKKGGKRCPKILLKTNRCESFSKCPIDCQMSEWGQWSLCSESCGEAIQVRRRVRLVKPRNHGRACEARRQKRFCSLPLCPDEHMKKKINYYMMYHRRY